MRARRRRRVAEVSGAALAASPSLRLGANRSVIAALQRSPATAAPSASPTPSSVFYVNFQNAMPPSTPDHSQVNPGPGGAKANRAGYTRVRQQKRMTIAWDTRPVPGGQVQLYARSVNVFFRLDPIEVAVSSSYAVGSCPYRVTLAHERSHVSAFARIFHAGRSPLVRRLNRVSVPTSSAPVTVPTAGAGADQQRIARSLAAQIRAQARATVAAMERDRNRKDSAAAYARVYARCPARDW